MRPKVPEGLPEFQKVQYEFAAHLRDPENKPGPEGIEDRRMSIYRGLFFNNLLGFISNNFPVLKKMYSDQEWRDLVREFFIEHRAHTPLFPELPREFLQYIEYRQEQGRDDPPFMLELAHYEWVELALSLDDNVLNQPGCERDGDLIENIPVRSPLAWLVTYQFPVHQIQPDFRPERAPEQATHLIVYRDDQDEVRFSELNAVSARLLQLISDEESKTGRELLTQLAEEMHAPDPEVIIQAGQKILMDFHQRFIILGSRPLTCSSAQNIE